MPVLRSKHYNVNSVRLIVLLLVKIICSMWLRSSLFLLYMEWTSLRILIKKLIHLSIPFIKYFSPWDDWEVIWSFHFFKYFCPWDDREAIWSLHLSNISTFGMNEKLYDHSIPQFLSGGAVLNCVHVYIHISLYIHSYMYVYMFWNTVLGIPLHLCCGRLLVCAFQYFFL